MAANPFWEDGIRKQIVITYDGDKTITNTELYSEAFELTERLSSSDNLRFGSCESSVVKFRITNTFEPLKDKEIDIGMYLENMESMFSVGKYKVFSDTPSANRKYRSIVAYDAMATIISSNVIDWYNGIFEENEELTLKAFRDSFFEYVGVTQKTTVLPNDNMIVTKTLDQKELTGGKVAYCICEINGCFGHINRDGLFEYVFLVEIGDTILPSHTLYPSNFLFPASGATPIITDILYPSNTIYPSNELFPTPEKGIRPIENHYYISAEYKDYYTERISKIQIRLEENNVGCEYGNGDNTYVIEDNFLVFKKETEELNAIAENLYNVISVIWYTPANILLKGNLQFNVGDAIKIVAHSKTIFTYILERTLSGIQSLKDSFFAEGLERQPEVVNTVERELVELKGQSREAKNYIENLITADRIITQDLVAAVARIGAIEADYVKTSTLVANYATITSLEAVDGKIDNLASIAITSQNISTVTLNASQITAGTIDTARLDVGAIAASTVTANTISAAMHSPTEGSIAAGVGSFNVIYWYTNTTSGGQPTYHQVKSYIDSQNRNILYVD